jgi:glycerol-3-phosphate dehydrogenase (NAD(P)+)
MQHNTPNRRRITVLGAGAWGTAVAIAVAARHDVLLWGRNADTMRDLDVARDNTHYLPGYPFPRISMPPSPTRRVMQKATTAC